LTLMDRTKGELTKKGWASDLAQGVLVGALGLGVRWNIRVGGAGGRVSQVGDSATVSS
jgi:hypothetical protein